MGGVRGGHWAQATFRGRGARRPERAVPSGPSRAHLRSLAVAARTLARSLAGAARTLARSLAVAAAIPRSLPERSIKYH